MLQDGGNGDCRRFGTQNSAAEGDDPYTCGACFFQLRIVPAAFGANRRDNPGMRLNGRKILAAAFRKQEQIFTGLNCDKAVEFYRICDLHQFAAAALF